METTFEQVYTGIRKMITTSELEPGQKVSQLELARKFACSPIPVVEAMRCLESEGLLTKEGRKMARVRKLSRDEIEGVYLVREGLESITARLCARRITPGNLEKLWLLVEDFENAVDHEEWVEVKQSEIDIHQFIAECSACQLLGDELNRLLLIERTAVADSEQPQDMKKYKLSHRAIVNAIADRDESSAEYLMKKHIQNGYLEFIGEPVRGMA